MNNAILPGLISELGTMLSSPLMQRSFIAAILVGLAAPVVGTYLVHRRLAMLGDGIGHIALTGVALGWLAGTAMGAMEPESYALPGAFIVSILGAITLEVIRIAGRTSTLNSDKYRIMRQRNWRCDISPARNELGYRPQWPLVRGVKATFGAQSI